MSEKQFEVALTRCFYCGRDSKLVTNRVLSTFHARKVKKMHGQCVDAEPCSECAEWMKQGVILSSVRDGEKGENPYRTGAFAVVKYEAIDKMITDKELVKKIRQARFCFIEDSTWDALGLPRETKGETNDQT